MAEEQLRSRQYNYAAVRFFCPSGCCFAQTAPHVSPRALPPLSEWPPVFRVCASSFCGCFFVGPSPVQKYWLNNSPPHSNRGHLSASLHTPPRVFDLCACLRACFFSILFLVPSSRSSPPSPFLFLVPVSHPSPPSRPTTRRPTSCSTPRAGAATRVRPARSSR